MRSDYRVYRYEHLEAPVVTAGSAAVLIGAFAWQEPLWVLALTAVCFMLYDGSRGRSRFRSFFYVYYPAHLLTLYFVGKWLG